MQAGISFDRASFKDPEGRVFIHHERLFRTLSDTAALRMGRLMDAGVLSEFSDAGLIASSKLVKAKDVGLEESEFGPQLMESKRAPIITYPYEWSFEMLRAGALTTLELLQRCLAKGLILKDATAFNLAFMDGRMRWIDILSIDDYKQHQPWDGYAQFCREFLFPLMLTAYKGVPFQPWLRGSLSGAPVGHMAALMNLRDWFRPGVFKHVVLQARLDRSFSDKGVDIRSSFKDARIGEAMIVANVKGLKKLIKGLPAPAASEWLDYSETHSYSDREEAEKQNFVDQSLADLGAERVVDLGANTGVYSKIAARHAELVIGADIDAGCIDRMFLSLEGEETEGKLVPMVLDLTNPSPSQGWALMERKGVFERLETQGFLALALLHHIRINGNVPLDRFVEILARLGGGGIVEWVDKKDGMARFLLRNRADVYDDYNWEGFRQALEPAFAIERTLDSHGGLRRMCYIKKR